MHVNMVFERIVDAIRDVIDDKDYEMQEVLDDYLNYCYNDKLIVVLDSWKRMRVQLAGTTFNFNVRENLYYDNIDRGFSAHDYLGLYKEKSVKAIGKISAIITAFKTESGIEYNVLSPIAGGIDFYGDLLFTSKEYYKNNPAIPLL